MPACDICGAPSNGFECDWPVEKFVRCVVTKLQVGDIVSRFDHASGERKTRGVAHVSELKDYSRYLGIVRVAITILWPWKETVRRFQVTPTQEFMVRKKTVCGAHVCDACMIERDANRMVICKNHWNAWERVA